MKKLLVALPLIAALAGCQTNQGALTGAAVGATGGAILADDDDRVTGALVGGAIGAAAGNYIGRNNNGNCVYENSAGQRYTAACP
jgi:uncharacterized membrane protein